MELDVSGTKKQEPMRAAAGTASGAVAATSALLVVANKLGMQLTFDEMFTIVTAVGILAPIATAEVARLKVWAPPKS